MKNPHKAISNGRLIYVIQVGETDDNLPIVKIGLTVSPERRFNECKAWVPHPIFLHEFRGSSRLERELHKWLRDNGQKELGVRWLRQELYICDDLRDLMAYIRDQCAWHYG